MSYFRGFHVLVRHKVRHVVRHVLLMAYFMSYFGRKVIRNLDVLLAWLSKACLTECSKAWLTHGLLWSMAYFAKTYIWRKPLVPLCFAQSKAW